jgi:hypothetical protein
LHHGSPRRQQQRLGVQNNNKLGQQESPSPILKPSSRVDKDSGSSQEREGGESKEVEENNNSNSKDLGSFGDNVLDIESRDRWVFLLFFNFLRSLTCFLFSLF